MTRMVSVTTRVAMLFLAGSFVGEVAAEKILLEPSKY